MFLSNNLAASKLQQKCSKQSYKEIDLAQCLATIFTAKYFGIHLCSEYVRIIKQNLYGWHRTITYISTTELQGNKKEFACVMGTVNCACVCTKLKICTVS